MNTAHVAVRHYPTTRSTHPAFHFFGRHWGAFQERRKRATLPADLCALDDRELMDIGMTRGEIDFVASNSSISPRGIQSTYRGTFFMVMLCTACFLLFASEAEAQCTARDVLQNQLRLKTAPSARMPQTLVRSAVDVPVWKTITVGTFADSSALSNALDAVGCATGNSAGEILARRTFSLSAKKANVELFSVSAAELGFETETASLADIYARAQQLGFGLAAAEVAPQLRLQYFDQPVGEFLIIGMVPIETWNGESIIWTVANGGAGLILNGQDGSADAQLSVVSRFLFVRSSPSFECAILGKPLHTLAASFFP
jgi:uncharacterized protein YjiS (DUF1127 family)